MFTGYGILTHGTYLNWLYPDCNQLSRSKRFIRLWRFRAPHRRLTIVGGPPRGDLRRQRTKFGSQVALNKCTRCASHQTTQGSNFSPAAACFVAVESSAKSVAFCGSNGPIHCFPRSLSPKIHPNGQKALWLLIPCSVERPAFERPPVPSF